MLQEKMVESSTTFHPVSTLNKHEHPSDICFIGAGYVGAMTAIVLAVKHPNINFYVVDKDTSIIDAWNSESIPIFEPGLEELLFDKRSERLNTHCQAAFPSRKLRNITFSPEIQECVAKAQMVFLCVGTPSCASNGDDVQTLDVANLEIAVQIIAKVSSGHKIIVQKSTTPCGTAHNISRMLKQSASTDASFDVISNPEFLAQGSAIHDLLYPKRVIIGHIGSGLNKDLPDAVTMLINLYTPWVQPDRIITMDAWSSELSKIASNAFVAQRISSINSLSLVCEATNANIKHVSRAVGADPRIGPLSLRAGFGFGGSCLHKDVCCLIYLARELGLIEVCEYWKAVIRMNDYQNRHISRRVMSCLSGRVTENSVAVLGFSFKENTSDTRNSTAITFVQDLLRNGISVNIYDPRVMKDQIKTALGLTTGHNAVVVADDIETACVGCNAIVLHTAWSEFSRSHIPWGRIADRMKGPKIFLDACGTVELCAMRSHGFDILEIGKKY